MEHNLFELRGKVYRHEQITEAEQIALFKVLVRNRNNRMILDHTLSPHEENILKDLVERGLIESDV